MAYMLASVFQKLLMASCVCGSFDLPAAAFATAKKLSLQILVLLYGDFGGLILGSAVALEAFD